MPLNSAQLYVQSILNGIEIPGVAKPLIAHVTPPNIEQLDGPRAYVWGGRLRGQRQTMPRSQGFKKLSWVIDVYLSYLTVAGTATVDQEFPVIVDAIMAATWRTTMPLFIDGQGQRIPTGEPGCSQILSIGEEFELEYPPERNPATMRMLYYTCRLGLDVYEAVQV